MSLQCPYCQSWETIVLESSHPNPKNNQPLSSPDAMSPIALATLGISISKSLNIPPIAGALAGVVIGGIWMLIIKEEIHQNSSLIYTRHYYCNNCDRGFNPNIRN